MRGGPTNFLLSLLPFIFFIIFYFSIPPLKATLEYSTPLQITYFSFGIILTLILRRRIGTVRDHEYHRSMAMKKVREVYKAEEEGVWDKDVNLYQGDMAPTNTFLKVSDVHGEADEIELDSEQKVEVQMLTESASVIKATGRLFDESSGQSIEEQVGTVGAVRKISPMDRFLDTISSWFGGQDRHAQREKKRAAKLQASALSKPVIAQRPVAPIQTTFGDNEETMRITSYSDSGGIDEGLLESGEVADQTLSMNVAPTMSESLESMAMLSTPTQQHHVPPTSNAHGCKGCGQTNPVGERFCLSCGLDL